MTKSLTEQLKNGTLKDGVYYIKDNDNILIGLRYSLHMTRLIDDGCPSFEVLAPVPRYDECKKLEASKTIGRLKEQLEIAMIVLGQIAMFSSDKTDAVQCAKAIKEINEVEQ